jgi:hypothetical protein
VDLVALDGGEVGWQWEGYFRVAAAMQAGAHELELPVCWGGCWDSLLAIASPEDSVRRLRRGLLGNRPEAIPRRPAFRAALAEYPA